MHRGDHGDAGAELAEHAAERARVDWRGRHDFGKPMLKSWPQRLTAVLSWAIQSSSVTLRPSQPNSMSKPPGVFM